MPKGFFLGVDTSCYTSSIALVSNGEVLLDKRIMLEVKKGARGLRQSEAVFAHIKNLTEIFNDYERKDIAAVGYSEKPSGRQMSYMPVFCVSETMAVSWSKILGVPKAALTHQQGHIYSAFIGRSIEDGEYVAFHVSGGTLDVLKVTIEGSIKNIETIGSSLDITCGQLIDRIGVAAGLPFPSGKHIEELYKPGGEKLAVNVDGLKVNLSGAETQAKRALEAGADRVSVLSGVIDCAAETLYRLAKNTGADRLLFTGGVMASSVIRQRISEACPEINSECIIAEKKYCSDNACGIALGAEILYNKGELV